MHINLLNKRLESFYLQKTETVAQALLGDFFLYQNQNNLIISKIVETEAYIPDGDLANHAAVGKTKRNEVMHSKGGVLYVYKIYGIHQCVNVVTEEEGIGCAVLIRAAEPIQGVEFMIENRGTDNIENLCRGPGNFAKAMGISLADNGKSLLENEIFIIENKEETEIISDNRIGISKSKELLLRYYFEKNKFVSGKKKA